MTSWIWKFYLLSKSFLINAENITPNVTRNTLDFIHVLGPTSTSMWALGDKVASSIIAQTVGVPTLPWSGSGEWFSNWIFHSQSNSDMKVTQHGSRYS